MESVRHLKPPRIRHYRTKSNAVYDSLPGARECRRKFLHFFPNGFQDETYLALEREHKWAAHLAWQAELDQEQHRQLLDEQGFSEIAARAIKIESHSNLLIPSDRTALRYAVKDLAAARMFATELYEFLHGIEDDATSFERWCDAVAQLPGKQTRLFSWPVVTVMGFIAQPAKHIFLKPTLTRVAAREYGYDFKYQSRPSFVTYNSLLEFTTVCRRDLRDLTPRDMIDLQSFIRIQGSREYEE